MAGVVSIVVGGVDYLATARAIASVLDIVNVPEEVIVIVLANVAWNAINPLPSSFLGLLSLWVVLDGAFAAVVGVDFLTVGLATVTVFDVDKIFLGDFVVVFALAWNAANVVSSSYGGAIFVVFTIAWNATNALHKLAEVVFCVVLVLLGLGFILVPEERQFAAAIDAASVVNLQMVGYEWWSS